MRNLNLNSLNTHDLDSEHGQTTLKQPKHICSLSSFSLHAFCCHSICLNWRFAIEVAEHWILKFDPKTVTNLWGEPFCYKRELKAVEPVGLIVRKTQHPQSSLTEDTLKAFKNLLPPLERVQQVTQCELTHTLLQAGPKKGVCKNQWTGCQTNMQCTTSASMQLMCVFGWCFQTSDATNLCNPFSTIWTVNCNNLKSVCKWVGVAWALLNCCVVGSSSPACQQLKNSHTWAHNTRAHKWQTKVCVTQFWNCSIIQTSTAIQWCQQKQDQSRSESTKSCFNSCNNCLRLQTCMQNVNTDIDDRHKLENAIKGMTHAVDFRQTSWEERLSDIPEMQIEHTKPHTLRTFNVFLKENIEPESRQDWKSTSVSDHGRMSRTNCETIEWNQKS